MLPLRPTSRRLPTKGLRLTSTSSTMALGILASRKDSKSTKDGQSGMTSLGRTDFFTYPLGSTSVS